jgi:hypothetical protein
LVTKTFFISYSIWLAKASLPSYVRRLARKKWAAKKP